jgi:hypothetical protein
MNEKRVEAQFRDGTRFICLFNDKSFVEARSREEAVEIIDRTLRPFARRHGDRVAWGYPHPTSGFVVQHPELDGRPTWAGICDGLGGFHNPAGVILPVGSLDGLGLAVFEA